jgi:hypothetical protein
MALRYIITKDEHRYKHERFCGQIALLFLLIADDGERLGAIASSLSYRGKNIGLCYEVGAA